MTQLLFIKKLMTKDFHLLLVSRVLSAALGLLTSLYLAKQLGVGSWGNVSLVIAILTYVALVAELSLFSTVAKVLVKGSENDLAAMKGVSVMILFSVSILVVALCLAMAYFSEFIFNHEVHILLLSVYTYSWVYLLPLYVEQTCKALGEIWRLSIWTILTKLLLMILVIALPPGSSDRELMVLYSYLVSIAAPSLFVIVFRKISFKQLGNTLRRFRLEHQALGRQLFLGKQLNLLSYNSDRMLLGFFCSSEMVGYYSLAMTMSSGISMFASTLAVSQFKSFGNNKTICSRTFTTYLMGTTAVMLASLLVFSMVVFFYLGHQYRYVIFILLPASLALMMQGLYQPYNSWLLANGKGAKLRAFLLRNAGINMISNLVLIPLFCGIGAAIASIVGNSFYYRSAKRTYLQETRMV